MRVLFFGNNAAAAQTLRWLRDAGVEVAGLVLHPELRRKCGAEMLASVDPSTPVIDGSKLRTPEVLERVKALRPDIGLSVFFGYILKPELLSLFPGGVVNVHPAYLPYNRGAYPNVWSIVQGTPAGVTVHYIDQGVDTGDIIGQRRVEVRATDTGESLYRRLEAECVSLLKELWPSIAAGKAPRQRQDGDGTTHAVRDVETIDRIDLDKTYKARELIDLLRARTFKPFPGAYFENDGKRIYVNVQLREEPADARSRRSSPSGLTDHLEGRQPRGISLRAMQEDDIEWIRLQRNRPEQIRYFRQERPIAREEQARWWKNLRRDAVRLFIVLDHAGDRVGYVGFNPYDGANKKAEFGIFIATEHQGKGYGRAALERLLEFGFEECGLSTIHAEMLEYPGEKRWAFYESLGFQRASAGNTRYAKDGHEVDLVVFFMTRDAWEQRHAERAR